MHIQNTRHHIVKICFNHFYFTVCVHRSKSQNTKKRNNNEFYRLIPFRLPTYANELPRWQCANQFYFSRQIHLHRFCNTHNHQRETDRVKRAKKKKLFKFWTIGNDQIHITNITLWHWRAHCLAYISKGTKSATTARPQLARPENLFSAFADFLHSLLYLHRKHLPLTTEYRVK